MWEYMGLYVCTYNMYIYIYIYIHIPPHTLYCSVYGGYMYVCTCIIYTKIINKFFT